MYKILFIVIVALTVSCNTLDIYEKTKPIQQANWQTNDTCQASFAVTDTAAVYNLYFVIRHQEQYPYKNIWVNVQIAQPDTTLSFKREFMLADNNKWLGSMVGDIAEHRIAFNAKPIKLKKGNYSFKVNHIMRQNPLPFVHQVGFRVQKAK